jgi:hypothetical protein
MEGKVAQLHQLRAAEHFKMLPVMLEQWLEGISRRLPRSRIRSGRWAFSVASTGR